MKIPKLLAIFALALSPLAAARAATEADPNPLVRRIIVFSHDTPLRERATIASGSGSVVRELPLINAIAVEMLPERAQALEAQIKGNPQVLRVDADPKINWIKGTDFAAPDYHPILQRFKQSPRAMPGLPRTAQAQPGQQTPWGILKVRAPEAWARTRGKGVKVAVIDTGIDYNHPDLKGNIAGGWNATDKAKASDFMDDNGHGTHVSGTIAALDNDTGVVGVAPEASLYGVKVLDSSGSGTFDDVIAGMQWAVEHHMQVASMSLGASQGNDSLKAAVEAMAKNGVVLVAAAGNDYAPQGGATTTVGYPAAYPGAIAISACNEKNQISDFSSRGPEVALIAPGENVLSLAPNNGLAWMDGTSMATPHVSGLAALAIAAKGISGVAAVRRALEEAAKPLPGLSKSDQGAGLVNAAKLVK